MSLLGATLERHAAAAIRLVTCSIPLPCLVSYTTSQPASQPANLAMITHAPAHPRYCLLPCPAMPPSMPRQSQQPAGVFALPAASSASSASASASASRAGRAGFHRLHPPPAPSNTGSTGFHCLTQQHWLQLPLPTLSSTGCSTTVAKHRTNSSSSCWHWLQCLHSAAPRR